jgi:conjugal transfer pilus assembly protein TraB
MDKKDVKGLWDHLSEKDRQNLKGVGLVGVGLVVMLILVTFVSPKNQQSLLQATKEKTRYKLPKNISSIEDKWLIESRQEIEEIQKQLALKEVKINKMSKQFDKVQAAIDSYMHGEEDKESLQKQIQAIEEKQNALTKRDFRDESTNTVNSPITRSAEVKRRANIQDPFARSGTIKAGAAYSPVIESQNIAIINFNDVDEKKSFDLANYLPAGSYARAILISAVDASVGLNSQSNPRQALFRIISDAKSAIGDDNVPLTSNIKGCVVTGAASGDLSSERAYVRLLKMTCQDQGRAIETDIEGYAADSSDGKTGIAGTVVSREGYLITKSFLAGIVSGIGSGLSAKYQSGVTYSDSFTTTDDVTSKQIIGQGVGEGIENASNTLAEYLINRAEQYQPVVSIASGKEIELVFMSGTFLDGRVLVTESTKNKR